MSRRSTPAKVVDPMSALKAAIGTTCRVCGCSGVVGHTLIFRQGEGGPICPGCDSKPIDATATPKTGAPVVVTPPRLQVREAVEASLPSLADFARSMNHPVKHPDETDAEFKARVVKRYPGGGGGA